MIIEPQLRGQSHNVYLNTIEGSFDKKGRGSRLS